MNSKEALANFKTLSRGRPLTSQTWDAAIEWARTEAIKACQDKEQELRLHTAIHPLVNDVVAWPFIEAIKERLK